MSAKVMTVPEFHPYTSPREMKSGQIGLAHYFDQKVLVLRTYDRLIDLNRPHRVWELSAVLDVELLPEGTEVKIVAEIAD